ncbi:MAG: hypothetical protein QXU16_02730 [Candidatus Micrarchaeaceae archaeon]
MGVQQCKKVANAKKKLENVLEELRRGTVVVEGVHDYKVLEALGINSVVTFDRLIYNHADIDKNKPVYIIMDNDKGGRSKEEKAMALLLEKGITNIDLERGKLLLKLTSARSVEELLEPIRRITENKEE